MGPLEVEGDEGPIAVKGLRLRAALRPYDVVESRPGGYALSVRAEDVDALRARFLSFGTCSISDPLTELVGLGLVPQSSTGPSAPTGPVDFTSIDEGPLA